MGLEIQKMLVLSTGHITKQTDADLRESATPDKGDIGGVLGWMYGYLVWVDTDIDAERWPDLAACFALAKTCGAQWVRFDCDMEPWLDGLPIYEWK